MMKRLLLVLLALLLIPTGYVCAGTMVADLSNLDIWLIGFDRTPVQGEMTPGEGYFSHQGLQLTYEVTNSRPRVSILGSLWRPVSVRKTGQRPNT